MAIGPFARILAQVVVPVVAILARALPAAYAQALNNAKKAGTTATAQSSSILHKRITKSEALQILNLTEAATIDNIEKQYTKYMQANKVSKNSGSFYLQSKIYRARELLVEFKDETTHAANSNGQQQQQQSQQQQQQER